MRILLVRTSALGDVVHCLPVLTALRRHLPEAEIAWVVEGAMAPLLGGHPYLSRVEVVHLRAWRKGPWGPLARDHRRQIRRSVAALRSFRPDLALDLMGNHKGALLARLSGAPRRIGLARSLRREPSSALWIDEPVTTPAEHAVDRALALLPALGVPLPSAPAPGDTRVALEAFGGDLLFPGAELDPQGDPAPGSYCLLPPGAGWGNKVYPPERWGEVARGIAEASGLETLVALSPAPAERAMAARVVETSGGAARTVEAAELSRLAALARGARLVLGGDSGPLHLAHALGAPVLLVMGPTDPGRHGPWGAPERALAHRLPCSFCYKRFDGAKGCLLVIRPEAVVERALELLRGR